MKSKNYLLYRFAVASVLLIVFCGCENNSKQIAELKRQNAELNERVKQLEADMDESTAVARGVLVTNLYGNLVPGDLTPGSNLVINLCGRITTLEIELMNATNLIDARWEILGESVANADRQYNDLLSILSSARPAPATQYRAATPAPTKNGVPITVYNQIVADARKQWPTDYDMQVYEIDKQCKAWLKVNGAR